MRFIIRDLPRGRATIRVDRMAARARAQRVAPCKRRHDWQIGVDPGQRPPTSITVICARCKQLGSPKQLLMGWLEIGREQSLREPFDAAAYSAGWAWWMTFGRQPSAPTVPPEFAGNLEAEIGAGLAEFAGHVVPTNFLRRATERMPLPWPYPSGAIGDIAAEAAAVAQGRGFDLGAAADRLRDLTSARRLLPDRATAEAHTPTCADCGKPADWDGGVWRTVSAGVLCEHCSATWDATAEQGRRIADLELERRRALSRGRRVRCQIIPVMPEQPSVPYWLDPLWDAHIEAQARRTEAPQTPTEPLTGPDSTDRTTTPTDTTQTPGDTPS